MTVINFEDLKPGMVLAEDAKHLNGRVLLSAGNILTEKHLHMFKSWGLTEAVIIGVDKQNIEKKSAGQFDVEMLKQAEMKMRTMFQHVDLSFQPMAELFRICVADYAKQLSDERDHDSKC